MEILELPGSDVRKLLSAGNGDGALLYLYLHSGGAPEKAGETLHLSDTRVECALALLRQLGLAPEPAAPLRPALGERPNYQETDVLSALDGDEDFRRLTGEVQRLLGRTLNTEELKILLSLVRYLGLPGEVISLVVCYCKDRARQRGSLRNPSLRTIEKEAYNWAEAGIDTLEAAAAYIQARNLRASAVAQVKGVLQIQSRSLTAAEERYVNDWLDKGFDQDAVALAYEKTCLQFGYLKWNYMNGILNKWHQAGLHTGEQVRTGDRKPPRQRERQLDADEQAAIARMLRED